MAGPQTLNLYNVRSNRTLPTILLIFLLCSPVAAETITKSKSKGLANVASIKMIKTYPNWVRVWIYSKGGLSSGLITMRYSYVKRFLKTCKEISDV